MSVAPEGAEGADLLGVGIRDFVGIRDLGFNHGVAS